MGDRILFHAPLQGRSTMPKKRLNVSWAGEAICEDFEPALRRYRRYLEDNGLQRSTIEMYVFRVGKYLEFAKTEIPSSEDFEMFRDAILEKDLSRSTINNYLFSIKKYHEMLGKTIDFGSVPRFL